MIKSELEEILIENPVIGAIRNEEDLEKILKSEVKTVFVLYGSILNIKNICGRLKECSKIVFVHIDLIDGLKSDLVGITFIKECGQLDGIITTKPTSIKYAKQLGLCTIQRIFIVDSLSLETGIKNVKNVSPDAVEVMPGVASKIIKRMENSIHCPIIAGGLIENKKDVMESLASGAIAVSTTKEILWNL